MVLPFAAALVIIAVHSVIAHKEYRFIYPAVVLLAVDAGIGLAQLVSWAQQRLKRVGRWRAFAATASAGGIAGAWCLLSFLAWTGPAMVALRYRVHDYLEAASFVAHEPAGCGIGLYGLDGKDWVAYGGYSHFHQPVPIYSPKDGAELDATGGRFDILLYTTELHPAPVMPAGFTQETCFGEVCLASRREVRRGPDDADAVSRAAGRIGSAALV
jgi:phosphatidylinositol glycan class B